MTRELKFGRRAALSGKASSLVVFVHGYGADGKDLLGLADPLARHLPDTVFVAPDAPERCTGNPMGYQWFPIPWLDGSSQADAAAGLSASTRDLNAFLDARLELIPAEGYEQKGNVSGDSIIEAQMPSQQFKDMGLREGDMLVVTPRKARVFVEAGEGP